MKIALVNQPWTVVEPPVISASLPKWSYQFARHLLPEHEVIYYARRGRGQKRIETCEGVEFHRMSGWLETYAVRLLERLRSLFRRSVPFFSSSLYYLPYAIHTAKDLQKQKCDIIHILNFSQFIPIIRYFNPKAKIVLNMRCEWLSQLDAKMIGPRLAQVDMIIGCCEYVTDKIRQRFPEYAEICHTVHNPVNPEEFIEQSDGREERNHKSKKLLFVGRLSPEKGLHHLLTAYKKILQVHPDAELEIVGPEWRAPRDFIVNLNRNNELAELRSFYNGRSYVSQLREELDARTLKRVTFSGLVPHDKLPEHYLSADVFLHPSLGDWFPKAIIEAMASSVPVVATNVGGIPEAVLDNETGILIEPGDVDALAKAVSDLLDDADTRKKMGDAGRKRVSQFFSWQKIVPQFVTKYEQLLTRI